MGGLGPLGERVSEGDGEGKGGGKCKDAGKREGKCGGGPTTGFWECGGPHLRNQCPRIAKTKLARKARFWWKRKGVAGVRGTNSNL